MNNFLIIAYRGDITKADTDAIVNAANSRLRGGGGVDGAIHRAGGPVILEECRKYDGCPTGEVRTTSAGNMPSRYVIHTVGPVYSGSEKDAECLADCYRNALHEAERLKCRSISFPAISTGVYGYPVEPAARIAVGEVLRYTPEKVPSVLEEVYFVLFSDADLAVYLRIIEEMMSKSS